MVALYGVPCLEEEDPRKRLTMVTYPATPERHDQAKLHYWRKLRHLTSPPPISMVEASQLTSETPMASSSLHPRELSPAQQVGLSAAIIKSSQKQTSHTDRFDRDPSQAAQSATASSTPQTVHWRKSHSYARNKCHTKCFGEGRPLSLVQESPPHGSAHCTFKPSRPISSSTPKSSRLTKLQEAGSKLEYKKKGESHIEPVVLNVHATPAALENQNSGERILARTLSRPATQNDILSNEASPNSPHASTTTTNHNREADALGQASICFFLPRTGSTYRVRYGKEDAKYQRSSQAFEEPPIDNSMLWLKAFYERELSSIPCTQDAVRDLQKKVSTMHTATASFQSKSLLEECCDAHVSFREVERKIAATDGNEQDALIHSSYH